MSAPVTRRAILGCIPASVAAVAAPAAAVASPEPVNPWTRMWRATEELSDALAAIDGGGQMAIVYPTGERPYPVMVGSIEAYEESKVYVRPEVRQAIAAHASAFVRLEAACEDGDAIAQGRLGRKVTAKAKSEFRQADKAERAALSALCAMPCRNMAERTAIARHVCEHWKRNDFQDDDVLAFIRSAAFGALP